ncbi:MAG: Dabb family protein [Thermacetogeniaceae bacterium]
MLHLEAGIDLLRSERSYDIALVAKFATLDDLQVYQMHPVHVKFKERTKAQIEHSVSVDYLSD